MLSCEREKLGTSDRMIITTAAAEGVKRRAVRTAPPARCRPMCSRRSSMPWRAPSWPTMGEIGPPGSRLTCPQRYDIVALLRSEEDATMKPRRPQPSMKRKRLDSLEDTDITIIELPR